MPYCRKFGLLVIANGVIGQLAIIKYSQMPTAKPPVDQFPTVLGVGTIQWG
jgi:hypothetical protein